MSQQDIQSKEDNHQFDLFKHTHVDIDDQKFKQAPATDRADPNLKSSMQDFEAKSDSSFGPA